MTKGVFIMKHYSIKKYILPALAVFFAAALIFRPGMISEIWGKLSGAVVPVITGIILAAIIDPAVSAAERLIYRLTPSKRRKKTAGRPVRYAAIAIVYIAIVAVAAAVIWIVIPRLLESASLFINSFDGYYSDLRRRYDDIADKDPLGLLGKFDELIAMLSQRLPDFFEKTFTVTAGIIRSAANFIVGAVLSVYILAGKEQITDFIKGAAQAAMSERNYRRAALTVNTVNSCLVNFISGQLTEAVVLGTLCFAGMVIFGFEYPLLISTIIGVTALIPVVGAFVGAIPSALVLFLVKPSSALWFIVFIIVLQQLENNLIYPKVVGKSVGLPPILILVAIIIGAEVGGAAGIMLGIPLISAVYTLAGNSIKAAGHEHKTEKTD